MKSLILDLLPGMSGDMFLSAGVGLGFKLEKINSLLSKLGFKPKLSIIQVQAGDIKANKLRISGEKIPSLELKKILKIIENLNLSSKAKDISLKIIKNLIRVERKIHGSLHSGEIASLDTLIDAIGTGLIIDTLKIDDCFINVINVPRYYKTASKYPPLAPGTLELLRGFKLKYQELDEEILTPTGASIIKTLCPQNRELPSFKPIKIAYSTGNKNLKNTQNLLRLILVQIEDSIPLSLLKEEIYVLETSIDDINPEILAFIQEKLYKSGALDVYIQPYYAKKNRIGFKLEVLSLPEDFIPLIEVIFKETTTNGIRYQKIKRLKLPQEIRYKNTPYGRIRTKISKNINGKLKFKPEYEDCKKLAQKLKLPLKYLSQQIINELNT